jgi:hypothetical protein
MCTDMTLSIAVQLVGGHADYLVKVGTPVFGILLAPQTARDNVQRVNDMVFEDRRVTGTTGNWGSSWG